MSQMIKGSGHLDIGNILKIPKKEVLIPRFKNLLQNQNVSKIKNKEAINQEVLMMNLIRKLSYAELQQIQRINNRIIRRKFNALKRRMRKSVQNNQNQSAIHEIFNSKNSYGGSLSSYLRDGNYEKIDISQKYRTIILNRMSTIQEIKSIQECKRVYKEEYDKRINSAVRSPNFKKMHFEFEKQSKQYEKKEKLLKMMGNGARFSCHQRIFTAKPKSNYASRSKLKKHQKIMLIIDNPKQGKQKNLQKN